MMIHEGSLQDVLDWFYNQQNESDLLVFFLSIDYGAEKQIQELIDQYASIDAITGRRITLMLFGRDPIQRYAIRRRHGSMLAIGADVLQKPQLAAQALNGLSQVGDSELAYYSRDEFAKAIARSTISVIRDIMQNAQISLRELPCLVVFYRGIAEPSIVPMTELSSAEGTINIVKYISGLYDDAFGEFRQMKLDQNDIQRKVNILSERNREAEAKVKDIVKILRSIGRKYNVEQSSLESLILSYQCYRFSGNALYAVRNLISEAKDEMLKDNRINKLQRLTARLSQICADMYETASDTRLEESLRNADNLRAAMRKLSSKIDTLQVEIVHKFGAKTGAPTKSNNFLQQTETVLNVLQKGSALVGAARKLLFLSS